MNKKVKKIIAKESLIIFAWIASTFLAFMGVIFFTEEYYDFFSRLCLLSLSAYPIYLITRFLMWAIKTLREK